MVRKVPEMPQILWICQLTKAPAVSTREFEKQTWSPRANQSPKSAIVGDSAPAPSHFWAPARESDANNPISSPMHRQSALHGILLRQDER